MKSCLMTHLDICCCYGLYSYSSFPAPSAHDGGFLVERREAQRSRGELRNLIDVVTRAPRVAVSQAVASRHADGPLAKARHKGPRKPLAPPGAPFQKWKMGKNLKRVIRTPDEADAGVHANFSSSLRGALATKQSMSCTHKQKLDCFADARNDDETLAGNSALKPQPDRSPRVVRAEAA